MEEIDMIIGLLNEDIRVLIADVRNQYSGYSSFWVWISLLPFIENHRLNSKYRWHKLLLQYHHSGLWFKDRLQNKSCNLKKKVFYCVKNRKNSKTSTSLDAIKVMWLLSRIKGLICFVAATFRSLGKPTVWVDVIQINYTCTKDSLVVATYNKKSTM